MIEAAIADVDQRDQRQHAEQGQARALEQHHQQIAVGVAGAAGAGGLWACLAAGDGAEHRQKYQGHGQRCQQAENHRCRQVLHELADHAGPEQQRQEHHQGGGGGGDHRPGHPRGRVGPGLTGRLPLMQVAVGQLGDDDGAVDQHAGHQDQAEQHDDVEGEAEHPDQQDAAEEGAGNGQADQQRRTHAHARHHQDQYQDDGGKHVVEQVAEHVLHFLRLIHDVADFHTWRQQGLGLLHQCLDLIDGLDDVGAAALGHFQHDGRLAVDAGEAGRVLEGAANGGDVGEGDHAVTDHLDRHAHHVFKVFDNAWHLHAHAACAGIQAAGSDQAVVAADQVEQLVVVDAVAVEYLRVDDDFQQVFTVTADLHRQHFGDAFDVLLQAPGDVHQLGLGNRPGQPHRQDREQRHVDLGDGRLVGFFRQLAARGIDLLAHVGQCHLGVEAGVELQGHRGVSFAGYRAHFLDALETAQLLLQWAHQQAFAIFRADAFEGHRNIDDGNDHVRVGFLGHGDVGHQPAAEQEQQDQDGGTATVECSSDQCVHLNCPRPRVACVPADRVGRSPGRG